MKRYRGTETVAPGVYFDARNIAFRSVTEDGPLPGTEAEEYRRVPTVALLVVGPVMGLAYIMFLPLAGFAMLAWTLAGKAVEAVAAAAAASARVIEPAWQPARAFLSRRKAARRKAARHKDEWSENTRKEIDNPDRGAA